MQKMQNQVLPPNHPSVYRVQKVVNRILEANKDIPEVKDKKWGVAVINSSIENAFVLPVRLVYLHPYFLLNVIFRSLFDSTFFFSYIINNEYIILFIIHLSGPSQGSCGMHLRQNGRAGFFIYRCLT